MAYQSAQNTIGVPDVTVVAASGALGSPWTGTANDLPSVTPASQLGQMIDAYDTTTFGWGKFILLSVPTSTTVTVGLLYQWDKNYSVTLVPAGSSSKNTGVAVALAYTAVTSSSTVVQYAWFLVQGIAPVLKTAVAVVPQSTVYISATAGRIKVLSSAGQTILGARSQNTATVSAGVSSVNVYFNFSALEGA